MRFTKIFALALLAVGLTSCLEDQNIEDMEYGMKGVESKKIIELTPNPAFLLPYSEEEQTVDFVAVRLAAKDPAPEDIVVQLSIDRSEELIAEYNENKSASAPTVVEYPAELYTFEGSGLTVTIPKGSREAIVPIRMKSSDLNADLTYGVGFEIVSVNKEGYTISGNFGDQVVRIGAQNKYHGTYTHTYDSSLGSGENDVQLITLGANAVTLSPGLLGVYSNAVTLTIDPATYKVTVSMTSLLPIETDPESYYDPETETFHLKWTSNGGKRYFEETFTKKN
ncbi:DUF1735 domain-containing protein [Pontibacter mangrovi]|nr:DUF1735 domain-containing protein [Pontibacter mangrovi]